MDTHTDRPCLHGTYCGEGCREVNRRIKCCVICAVIGSSSANLGAAQLQLLSLSLCDESSQRKFSFRL